MEETLKQVLVQLKSISDDVTQLRTAQGVLSDQQKSLEGQFSGQIQDISQRLSNIEKGADPRSGLQGDLCGKKSQSTSSPDTEGFAQVDTDALQSSYRAVKDSVQAVKLPDDLYVGTWAGPVSKDLKELATNISSVSKYVETALKLTGSLCEKAHRDQASTEIVNAADSLMITLVAATRFLQEEQALIVVGSQSGPKTRKFFKSTGGANSAFSNPFILERVKVSAQLAALPQESTRDNYNKNYRGSYNHFDRGQGRGRGRFGCWEFTLGFTPSTVPSTTSPDDR